MIAVPSDYGVLNPKFREFRKEQLEALDMVVESDARFLGLSIPPGGGKSLIAMAIAGMGLGRVAVLTATKALQDQYARDAVNVNLGDHNWSLFNIIKGRSNYECNRADDCHQGRVMGCRDSGTEECAYQNAYRAACYSNILANYAHWVAVGREGRGQMPFVASAGPPIDILILDEAHLAHEELSRQMQVVVTDRMLKEMNWWGEQPAGDDEAAVGKWAKWAGSRVADCAIELGEWKKKYPKGVVPHDVMKRIMLVERVGKAMGRVAETNPADWILEVKKKREGGGAGVGGGAEGVEWVWDVLWPAKLAERYLFKGVRKVILMSGTLTMFGCRLVGVPPSELEFREWDRIFPEENTPVYYWPVKRDAKTKGKGQVAVRISYNSSQEDLGLWRRHMDQIIREEGLIEQKGMIHTVSYDRQRYLMDESEYGEFMIGNTRERRGAGAVSVGEAAEEFRSAKAPAILSSPSFVTGWDFPADECEWIIVCKIPFPSTKDKVMKARAAREPRYPFYMTMMELVQVSLRGSRTPEDKCRVYITDGHAEWFLAGLFKGGGARGGRYKYLAPSWWRVRWRGGLRGEG